MSVLPDRPIAGVLVSMAAAWMAAGCLLLLLPGPAAAQVSFTRRVSVASSGEQGNGASHRPGISGDGRRIVFQSRSTNLVSGDTNNKSDIFLHDREVGTTVRIGLGYDGSEGNGDASGAAISADGRWVAFDSNSSNLVRNDRSNGSDVFLQDLLVGDVVRVSIAADGSDGSFASFAPDLSADGRLVAFYSWASNLVSGDTNGRADIFVRDMWVGETRRVSVASNGTQANADSYSFRISDDGRFVVFTSAATNLVPGDTNNATDIFVHELATGQTLRVNVADNGTQANGASSEPSISGDGRFIAYYSYASTLVPGDTNAAPDVFVHDRLGPRTVRVSGDMGAQPNSGSMFPAISADGALVVYSSAASNLVPGDTNLWADAFLSSPALLRTIRVSVATNGTQADGASGMATLEPAISADGSVVVYGSDATNLVPFDTNAAADIFIHVREAPQAPGSPSNLAFQVQASTVTFTWNAPTTGGPPDTYVFEYGDGPGAVSQQFATGSAATSLQVPDVPAGTYFVRVRARNSAGTSPTSNEVMVELLPGMPSSLAAAVNAGIVAFNWNPPAAGAPVQSYVFRVGLSPGATDIQFDTGSAATTFTAFDVPAGTYYVRVHARSGAALGSPSNELPVVVSTGGCGQPPGVPDTLGAFVNGQQVVLSWGPGPGCPPTSYVLEAGLSPGASDVFAGDIGNHTLFSAPAPPGTYYVRVRGLNEAGTGPASNEVTVVIAP